jgi:hypothetical protein
MERMKIPKFENEADEANWLYENREALAAEFMDRISKEEDKHRASLETELLGALQTNELVLDPESIDGRSLVCVLRGKLGQK